MLVNGGRALLVYLRDHEGDPGLSSRDPNYAGPPDAQTEFVLDNGQLGTYPTAWTVPLEQAEEACRYFVISKGERSPQIVWHDDSAVS